MISCDLEDRSDRNLFSCHAELNKDQQTAAVGPCCTAVQKGINILLFIYFK